MVNIDIEIQTIDAKIFKTIKHFIVLNEFTKPSIPMAEMTTPSQMTMAGNLC